MGHGWNYFYLSFVLTFTGVLLMFYYHPTKADAFQRHPLSGARRPLWKTAAQHAPLGSAHLMVITTWLHMFRGVNRFLQKATRVQLVRGRCPARADSAACLQGIAARRPARLLGGNCRNEHGKSDSNAGSEGPFGVQLGMTPFNDVRFGCWVARSLIQMRCFDLTSGIASVSL